MKTRVLLLCLIQLWPLDARNIAQPDIVTDRPDITESGIVVLRAPLQISGGYDPFIKVPWSKELEHGWSVGGWPPQWPLGTKVLPGKAVEEALGRIRGVRRRLLSAW